MKAILMNIQNHQREQVKNARVKMVSSLIQIQLFVMCSLIVLMVMVLRLNAPLDYILMNIAEHVFGQIQQIAKDVKLQQVGFSFALVIPLCKF